MRLHDLMSDLPVSILPPENPDVTGVCHDSRRVGEGDLYVAINGARFDGRSFSPEAVERGAVAVLGSGRAPSPLGVPWIGVADPRPLLGPIAARLFGQPHEDLLMVGITGTNGKSTVTALLTRILAASGRPTGSVGTLGYQSGGRSFEHRPASEEILHHHMTTPEASDLFRALAEMHQGGAEAVVMEVSSHALALGRVAGVRYDLALFTNLTHDHLDFHGDLESYFEAKAKLFDKLKPGGRKVINVGDEYGRRLADRHPEALTYSTGDAGNVRVRSAHLGLDGIQASFLTPRGDLEITSPLLGRFNLENLASAVAAAEALGLDPGVVRDAVARLEPLAGRLQPVEAGQSFPILVDFAHTPAALEALLSSFREIARRKIALVFGCGGDRDPGKRVPMGRIAGEGADLPVATSDNPRGEDPHQILAAVEQGLRESGNDAYHLVPDRREAIRRAISMVSAAPQEWAVLVAGKGHEEFQIVEGRKLPFSDRDEIVAALVEQGLLEGRDGGA